MSKSNDEECGFVANTEDPPDEDNEEEYVY